MILVSVGTQLPFDRMVVAIDHWAAANPNIKVVAQIGPSQYSPKAMEYQDFYDHSVFREMQERCSLMVSHAGIGSMVSALELGKPIIILGRDHLRHEHRNGHQISTVERFGNLPGIYAARDEAHLLELLDSPELHAAGQTLSPRAPAEFVTEIARLVVETPSLPLWRLLWRRFKG